MNRDTSNSRVRRHRRKAPLLNFEHLRENHISLLRNDAQQLVRR
jgi:hypothetical protein